MKIIGIFILITIASFFAVCYVIYKILGEEEATKEVSLIWTVTILLSLGITLVFFY